MKRKMDKVFGVSLKIVDCEGCKVLAYNFYSTLGVLGVEGVL
jgi:hypothetical protein